MSRRAASHPWPTVRQRQAIQSSKSIMSRLRSGPSTGGSFSRYLWWWACLAYWAILWPRSGLALAGLWGDGGGHDTLRRTQGVVLGQTRFGLGFGGGGVAARQSPIQETAEGMCLDRHVALIGITSKGDYYIHDSTPLRRTKSERHMQDRRMNGWSRRLSVFPIS